MLAFYDLQVPEERFFDCRGTHRVSVLIAFFRPNDNSVRVRVDILKTLRRQHSMSRSFPQRSITVGYSRPVSGLFIVHSTVAPHQKIAPCEDSLSEQILWICPWSRLQVRASSLSFSVKRRDFPR